jgi:small subunit ribosomal protein S20
MPNTKSAMKAMRGSARKRVYNLRTKEKFKTAVKGVKKALEAASEAEALKALTAAYAALDKAAKKKVIHKNTANRKKSRLAKAINKLKK